VTSSLIPASQERPPPLRSEDETVFESSLESFPASDPPSWTAGRDLTLDQLNKKSHPTEPPFVGGAKKTVSDRARIVIVGGGFGGLSVARHLDGLDAEITLIDRHNYHLFQPLLYQVATGALSPANISAPLRAILKRSKNTTVLLGEVTHIDAKSKVVRLANGKEYSFDYLVLATGADHNYFGHQEWRKHAPGLKTIEDAIEIRSRVLSIFEAAELEEDPEKQRKLLRFVVVGGGSTGVELAGALGEIAQQTLKGNFRRINPSSSEILIIEGGPQILPGYSSKLVAKAKQSLARHNVTVKENWLVKEIHADHLLVECAGALQKIESSCILWAAGVKPSWLGTLIANEVGAAVDRSGRVVVGEDLSIPTARNIFVIGDLASREQDGKQIQAVAPAAMQEGKYVARTLRARISGLPDGLIGPFRYHDRGAMTIIARSYAVVQIGTVSFSGFLAWLLWLWVHIVYLAQFSNRLLVLFQWGWSYFTHNRSARIITSSGVGPERGI
jgi:NADH dehydrogenase